MMRLRATCVVLTTMQRHLTLAAPSLWRSVDLPPHPSTPAPSLADLSEDAAFQLRKSKERVSVFEATTGGLINAALLAAPGASRFTTCGAVSYTSSRAVAVLGPDPARPLGEPLDSTGHRSSPQTGAEYMASKQERVAALARRKRLETGATWCICENGACGPTFSYPDVSSGFSAIFVSGPVERGILVRSSHARREDNMWAFTEAALGLLAECVSEASRLAPPAADAAAPALLSTKEDRYGGVEVGLREGAHAEVSAFVSELHEALEGWSAASKRGVWLRLPLDAHGFVSAAVSAGFRYHHATPDYLQLTKWLPEDAPSSLPRYAFTTIGVGGVVVNGRGEVLMVQERVSPSPRMQGSWKLPGGLAESGEDFADVAAREVLEETGVSTALDGVVSLRHSHGRRFGQSDLYVLVKLRAETEAIVVQEGELADARWMSREEIKEIVEREGEGGRSLAGKVSMGNHRMIENALGGALIEGVQIPDSTGASTMMYRA
jgi:8-oxo-dGTP pyrophosphatase MutT (NUDIX family)/nicotinamide mononucleotide (NMN) deamidase PncC